MQVQAALTKVMELVPPILSAASIRAGARVSRRQADILGALDARDPVRLTDLAARLGVTISTMSLGIARLIRKGFVRRERDPVDRRVLRLILSPTGRRLKETAPLLDAARLRRVLSRLEAAQRAAAVKGLELIAEAARRELEDQSKRPRF